MNANECQTKAVAGRGLLLSLEPFQEAKAGVISVDERGLAFQCGVDLNSYLFPFPLLYTCVVGFSHQGNEENEDTVRASRSVFPPSFAHPLRPLPLAFILSPSPFLPSFISPF
jgi:hypothetical protein